MNDVVVGPTTETTHPAAALNRNPRNPQWRSRVRWFAAEFVVVVVGVLTALAVQAWYAARHDRAREQAYVRQLQSEFSASAARLERALQIQKESELAAVQLQRAALMATRPPEDSLATWAIDLNYYSDPNAGIGTARALITTGDILLLRDEPLRSALVDVVESTTYAESQLRIWQPYFLDAIDRLDAILSNTRLIAARGFTARLDSLTASRDWLPEKQKRRSTPAPAVSAVLDSQEFQHVLRAVRLAAANLRGIQEEQLAAVRAAQQILDRAAAN